MWGLGDVTGLSLKALVAKFGYKAMNNKTSGIGLRLPRVQSWAIVLLSPFFPKVGMVLFLDRRNMPLSYYKNLG